MAVILAAALSVVLTGCSGRPEPFQGKVLVMGFDSATWDVIDPMLARGELPNLARLVNRGSRARLKTLYPAESPLIWTSIVTGKVPAKHGVDSFLARLPREYESIPVDSGKRRSKALWNILSDNGIGSTFVSWWATWPAEQVIGRMVTDRFGSPGLKGATFPEELATVISAHVPLRSKEEIWALLKLPRESDLSKEAVDEFDVLADAAKWDLQRLDTARYMLQADPTSRLFAVYFRSLDPVQHLFWKYKDTSGFDVPEELSVQLGGAVENYYRLVDMMVGEMVAAVPEDTVIVVLSDHGMSSFTPEKMGYLMSREYIGEEGGHLFLRFPKVNRLLSRLGYLNYAADCETVDWSHTKVFADDTEHLEWTRNLIFNVKGDYPQGVVEEDGTEKLSAALAKDLTRLRTESGKDVITAVKPVPGNTGLVVSINPGLSVDDMVVDGGARFSAGEFIGRFYNSGEHGEREHGIFVIAGPVIKADNTVDDASVLDVTPTLLYCLGLPVARDMDGRVLAEVFTDGYREDHPVEFVDSYGDRAGGGGERGVNAGADKELKKSLKALGYIQ